MKATTKTDLFKTTDFNKCSGMDGFPNERYKVFWKGISLFVTSALNYTYAFDCSRDLKNKVKQFIASLISLSLIIFVMLIQLINYRKKKTKVHDWRIIGGN